MSREEWTALAVNVNQDIAGLTRAYNIRAGIRQAIGRRQLLPTEESFIDEDAFGYLPTEPRVFSIDGSEVKVWKTHRAGLHCSDIKGADLHYEIEDHTYILVQYKSPRRSFRTAATRS